MQSKTRLNIRAKRQKAQIVNVKVVGWGIEISGISFIILEIKFLEFWKWRWLNNVNRLIYTTINLVKYSKYF